MYQVRELFLELITWFVKLNHISGSYFKEYSQNNEVHEALSKLREPNRDCMGDL